MKIISTVRGNRHHARIGMAALLVIRWDTKPLTITHFLRSLLTLQYYPWTLKDYKHILYIVLMLLPKVLKDKDHFPIISRSQRMKQVSDNEERIRINIVWFSPSLCLFWIVAASLGRRTCELDNFYKFVKFLSRVTSYGMSLWENILVHTPGVWCSSRL